MAGYEAQNDLIYPMLDNYLSACEKNMESLVIEGVHLSIRVLVKLLEKHPFCVPFLIFISNQVSDSWSLSKHMERFAIRAKYMTLEPRENKYMKYITNIRKIQDYLCEQSEIHQVL